MTKRLSLIFAVTIIAWVWLTPLRADPVAVRVSHAPNLVGGPWIGSAPGTSVPRPGKVTVLLFWTHGCINCKHNLGYWNDWARDYKNSDVDVISVHTPEGDWERPAASVSKFVKLRGLDFPVLVDNDHKNWIAYDVQAWPTEILIDKRGRIRYEFDGELNWGQSGEYRTVRTLIEALRAEKE